jgi:hypothetical protein
VGSSCRAVRCCQPWESSGGNMASIGPVEYVVIGFPGNRAQKARILAT